MGGVAYTVGSDLDDDHKQIHFSTDYISQIPENRLKEEMMGVIVHEMVHCWQWNALGSAPGGLIEGIADWVRLKAGYAPPHWRRHADGSWDSGYERTGYFLEFLEKEHGKDIVRRINEGLRDCEYEEGPFWHNCCGKSIEKLWEEYQHHLASQEKGNGDEKEEARADVEEGKEEEEKDCEDTKGVEHDSTEKEGDEANQADDTRSSRSKARRGGNMNVPVRPHS
jgi:DNA-directed RNA polymerase subunit N (RpoN/RPB10)